uniref:Uncharacterized protein n=1 Tax=Anopheles farauti TaxID=69004 RepID=A0A182QQM5_9DIPT
MVVVVVVGHDVRSQPNTRTPSGRGQLPVATNPNQSVAVNQCGYTHSIPTAANAQQKTGNQCGTFLFLKIYGYPEIVKTHCNRTSLPNWIIEIYQKPASKPRTTTNCHYQFRQPPSAISEAN